MQFRASPHKKCETPNYTVLSHIYIKYVESNMLTFTHPRYTSLYNPDNTSNLLLQRYLPQKSNFSAHTQLTLKTARSLLTYSTALKFKIL